MKGPVPSLIDLDIGGLGQSIEVVVCHSNRDPEFLAQFPLGRLFSNGDLIQNLERIQCPGAEKVLTRVGRLCWRLLNVCFGNII